MTRALTWLLIACALVSIYAIGLNFAAQGWARLIGQGIGQ